MVAIGLAVRVLAGVLHDYGSTLSFCHEPGVAPEPRCHVTGISLVRRKARWRDRWRITSSTSSAGKILP
jgi:hypothetical protein